MRDRTEPPPHITALGDATCYPHAVERVTRLETHISWVFLTGAYAYKLKKPVQLPFLDFSTLEARRHYCEEELRLNRRFAPELYLEVVEIRGSSHAPRIGGDGPLLDYAVRMRQFPQEALASRLLARGELTAALVLGFAARLADFHSKLPPSPAGLHYGTSDTVWHHAAQNFEEISALLTDTSDRAALASLRHWTEQEFQARSTDFRERHDAGRVRECHGDLHLANIVALHGELIPFDCIEFSADLRWNDVMSEVAFLVMDLFDRGAPGLAHLFLNGYLEASGDYEGLIVLRFYLVYRALVRAKVHLIRARQATPDPSELERLMAAYRGYIALAARCATRGRAAILLTHGFSGSGKSTVAEALVQALGAVRVRSDVERKRLQNIAPLARTRSTVADGLYRSDSTDATYARLADAARAIAKADYTAIVDAAFLKRSQRSQVKNVAAESGVPCFILDMNVPDALLRERIARRAMQGTDASEATIEVLEHQLATAEPIAHDEGLPVIPIDHGAALPLERIDDLLRAAR